MRASTTDASTTSASTFSGRVVQAGSLTPIADAEVAIAPSGERGRTDSTGQFRFTNLEPGQRIVEVRRIGYAPRRELLTLLPDQETVWQIELTSQATKLDTVRTTSATVKYTSPLLRGFEARRANNAGGTFITEKQLREYDYAPLDIVLRRRTAGILFVHAGSRLFLASARGGDNTPGNTSRCWLTVFIDGVEQHGPTPGLPFDITGLSVHDYGAVELYRGPSTQPVEFGKRSKCGILLLWTRER